MNLQGPLRYKVVYTPQKPSIICERGTPRFAGNASGANPKLYIFSRDGVPIYVGATIRSMGARMRDGWKASGENGFYGYRFRHEGSAVDLDVWADVDPVRRRDAGMRSGSDIETIEAEVVYLLRHRTGQWPAYQTEIHFYQSNFEHRREAERVMAHYGL
ncbi:hypothetical protein LRP31_24120 [Mesorhizobium mediterraneum]|uniref:GIY-YIG domain-containing protein n=1 Tax=Mesorhizobium mediterraneum TaxID=43617 RepID=A0AB36R943_9HYPH|nr:MULTISPECIES: hypothetical protein [Mesorhizobium]PAQ01091.1 hypothetical protein CIT25_17295 [Mesorhizobium mediterraneum]RWN41127.1 MAG: hypothetical protein EOR96_13630 [Mesorhizobium sp.]RWP47136.1 MAG: hypothetical protein EOR05_18995 [Mesorhizobium sp.]TIU15705.1 MAG: hypothetical protein E5W40_02415 [Mesorhizobium sp.]WIW52125.1 hypothetical protein LRP31_24120 [Mesorhizobium mediterraneum]